ncbi:MAG TPA: hypothetical protein VFQ00_00990, partial [Terriglobales bacterium]|nr:hypothetical protein [Terriglobales bacterium]
HDPRAITPNSWQWNFSIEQQLAQDTSLELAYVGNRGIHLTDYYDLNTVPVDNRIASAFAPSGNAGAVNALRPAPTYGSVAFFSRNADSYYHALQVLLRSRLGNHSTFQASYTWSHSIADFDLADSSGGLNPPAFTDFHDPGLDRGNSTINRPNIFVGNAVFFLPKFAGANGFIKNALGGWEFNTIATAENGNSITIYANTPSTPGAGLNSLAGTGFTTNIRPNIVPGVSCTAGTSGDQVINPDAFTFNGFAIGQDVGNEPRGYCHAPNYVNFDLALYKNFHATERLDIQFRFDAFNALNHPNFRGDQIGTTLNGYSATCGGVACTPANNVITTTAAPTVNNFGQATLTTGGRQFQYGLKFIF